MQNFMSIGKEPVEVVFKQGVNVITGTNKDKIDRRNGVGKSSVADALFFAMYGNVLRPIKKEAIKNDSTRGTCSVSLELDVVSESTTQSVRISRELEPSRVLLEIDNVDKTRDSIANTTEYISELVGCNSDVFENCVVMTLNNALPFMCRKKQEKRDFIESIFNLEVFSRMLKEAKAEYSDCKSDLDVVAGRKDEVNVSITTIKNQQSTFEATKLQKINRLKGLITELQEDRVDQVDKLNKEVDLSEDEISTLKNFISVIYPEKEQTLNTEQQTVSNLIAEKQANIQSAKTALAKMNANMDNCPVCLRTITPEDRAHVDAERESTNLIIAANEDVVKNQKLVALNVLQCLTDLKKEKRTADSKIETQNAREKVKTNIKNAIAAIDTNIASVNNQIAEAQKEEAPLDTLLDQQKDKLKEIDENIKTCNDKLNLLNQVKFVFSEEGVKSLIVKRVLNIFNTQLAYYLQKLDSNCTCVFNEYFEEVIVNDKGKEYSYFSLSGAERKSIDLACLFTFMDIRRLQGNVAFNISIFDELLDSSLDAKGIDLVLSVLKERVDKFNECVYIISHRKESTKMATGEVIYLVKSNGVCTRVPYSETHAS